MATQSLKRDHDLIEKVLKATETTIQLLRNGKEIPKEFLLPVIDFSKNFTIFCHHSKEETTLFPALEETGMPRDTGPIGVMLMEHERTKEIVSRMEKRCSEYLESGNGSELISVLEEYVDHVSQHLWKENNRLFMMAEMQLAGVRSGEVEKKLDGTERERLGELGKDRAFYEELAEKLCKDISK